MVSNSSIKSSKSYKIWWNILLINCFILIFFGFLIYISAIIPNSGGLFSGIGMGYNGNDTQARSLINFISAVLGATIIGWSCTMFFLIWYPIKKKEKWALYAMVISIIVWYIPDTYVSIYFLMWSNVILNTIILLMIEVPLIALKLTNELI